MYLYYLGLKIVDHNKKIRSFKHFLNQMTDKYEIIWATKDKSLSVSKLCHLCNPVISVTLSDFRLEESLV